MGKYRDHRQPRGHGFDSDDNGESSEPSYFQRRSRAPAPPAMANAAEHDAEVLWVNADKGFGFVRLEDGSEAFLHVSKLQAVGNTSLPQGAHLKVRIEVGHKGPQVVEVLSVAVGDSRSTTPVHPTPPVGEPALRSARPGEEESTGVVKRYDATKGFGFIKIADGADDVFVHASAVSRSGLTTLETGQNVVVRYVQGQKGLEARSLRLG